MTAEQSLSIVLRQLQDVVMTQKRALDTYNSELKWAQSSVDMDQTSIEKLQQELEDERQDHARTKALLADKTDKLQFALGEIEILTNQLNREKAIFEASFGKISDRAKQESTKSHKLEVQCSSIKAEKEMQDEILAFKDMKIADLKKRLANQKESHQRHLDDVKLRMQQEAYISRNLATGKEKSQR